MTSRLATRFAAMTLLMTLAIPARAVAHEQRYPYILIDLGTLGGPTSGLDFPAIPLTNSGTVLGEADTALADPNYPIVNPFQGNGPNLQHAFAWSRGVMTDLGALPGTNNSAIFEINDRGVGAGNSGTGAIDPATGWPAMNAVVWKDGRISNLGTLPGGNESLVFAINNSNQVTGFASNGIPDPYSIVGFPTQTRTFLWQNGRMQDIGTLGGPDSFGGFLNERGQVAGQSYTNATPVPATGLPTQDPFLWQDGHMQDLGTLGGTQGTPNWLNNRGQVVGSSNVVGDQSFHPFLWDGHAMIDLGTQGGNYGSANWINDAGAVVGWATGPQRRAAHAMLWYNGATRDLGVPPGDVYSLAVSNNMRGQVVGVAGPNDGPQHGFLWDHGTMADMNTLVAPSDIYVVETTYVNNRGMIVGTGTLQNGAQHAVLMVPSDEADREGLISNAPALGTTAPGGATRASVLPCTNLMAPRGRYAHRYQLPCAGI